MKTKKLIIAAVAGTATMTLFSYIVSRICNKDFSEPKLLARAEAKQLNIPTTLAPVAGWGSHLGIGLTWTYLFSLCQKILDKDPAFKDVLLFGTVDGLSAMGAWKIILKELPPRSDEYYKHYFLQLFISHFIFFGTLAAAEKVMRGNE